jgi:hypothetical protein
MKANDPNMAMVERVADRLGPMRSRFVFLGTPEGIGRGRNQGNRPSRPSQQRLHAGKGPGDRCITTVSHTLRSDSHQDESNP